MRNKPQSFVSLNSIWLLKTANDNAIVFENINTHTHVFMIRMQEIGAYNELQMSIKSTLGWYFECTFSNYLKGSLARVRDGNAIMVHSFTTFSESLNV